MKSQVHKRNRKPIISVVIPTFQAGKLLNNCLRSIAKQDYPPSKFEILIIDGGSTDRTLEIAKKFNTVVLHNPRKDAESGKAIGIEHAKGEIVALIDADNEIVHTNWLKEMVKPFLKEREIFGVESPWLVRKKDSYLNQYFAMLKISDPLARRFHPKMKIIDKGDYIIYKMKLGSTPIVGANGFLYRKKYIKMTGFGDKFEEVNFVAKLVNNGYLSYAVPKNVGVYHHYVSSLTDYIKKRIKIGRKFMKRKSRGQLTWVDQATNQNFAAAVLYNISIIGPLIEAMREYKRTKNRAWFWHPVVSFLTIIVYAVIFITFKIFNAYGRK